jgi:hypothetical protein
VIAAGPAGRSAAPTASAATPRSRAITRRVGVTARGYPPPSARRTVF